MKMSRLNAASRKIRKKMMNAGPSAVQKTVNAVLAVLSVALFFLNAAAVWRRLVDW